MWTVLVVLLISTVRGQNWLPPASQCPNVFTYEHDQQEGWVGLIAAFTPAASAPHSNRTLKMRVTLTLAALLQGRFVGRVELREAKETVVSRLQRGDAVTILYRVYFPTQNPLPRATSVQMNGRELCVAQNSVSDPDMLRRTTITLSHTLYVYSMSPVLSFATPAPSSPPIKYPPVHTYPTSYVPTTPFYYGQPSKPQPTTQPNYELGEPSKRQPTFAPDSTLSETEGTSCGTLVRSVLLVQHGEPAQDWPWLAAIFKKTQVGLEFYCGGSLVSQSHVVTAAHCVQQQARKAVAVETNTLLVILGKRDLLRWTETASQSRDVLEIVLHPSQDVDIAVLMLTVPVRLTSNVSPVCLWSSSSIGLAASPGTVVGWGRDEKGNRVTDQPRQVTMPLASQEECLRSHPNFYYLTNENTFCAGDRNGSGPCSGDSGGGMYTVSESRRWMLRGVVSRALLDETTQQCDLRNYVVFTDTAKLAPWIRQVMLLRP